MRRPGGSYGGHYGGYYGGYYGRAPYYGYGHYSYRYYYPFYGYYGAFYGPWFGYGWGYPYYGYGWGYPYGYPYGYGGAYYGYDPNTSDVRLQVTPREAEVYVDGSLAGVVDDFDGAFQRLHLPPGEHEIEIYMPGFRSVRQKVFLQPGKAFNIKYTMEPLGAGEPQEPKPVPAAPAIREPQGPPSDQQPQMMPPPSQPRQGPGWRQPQPSIAVSSNFGTLAIRVQPTGADVLIDGERWQSPDGQQRLVVEVAEGQHHVEIRRDGYQNFVADVTVRRGETTPVNVSLLAREH